MEKNIMHTAISSKYQVVIPKPVRDHLKLRPKQNLTVIEKDGMLILIPQVTTEFLCGLAKGEKIHENWDKKDRY